MNETPSRGADATRGRPNALVVLGATLLVVVVVLTVLASNPLEARLVQASFPTVLSLGIVAYGRRHDHTLSRHSPRPLGEWLLAILLYFVFVGAWFFVLSETFKTTIPLAILTSITAGTALGAVIGVYAVRLNAANEELVAANDELSAFASIVSHDVRNPVQVASGSLDLLAADLPDDDENVERIEHSLDRIDTIIENVLVLTRGIEDVSDSRPVELAAAASDAWETTDAPDASLSLADPPTVTANEDLLATLLENLFRNANDHSPDAVTVTVGELADEDGFYVEDDGPGIPAGDRDGIFGMGESGSGGTGIGLFVVGRVADVHGWAYRVTSGAAGGARFEFRT
ncbi:HAMP domain-containing sensor histidine kinase [Halorubellus litoreus]|uniref:histidine kinase n=1 Tax=Halorubellus litoreus TaxID=755308 RepID=A0ABD5VJ15_9EURY